jgi:hypothetical protein
MASQDSKSVTREVKPNQWLVLAAWSLTLVAFFFCFGGLLGVWWSGTQDFQVGQSSIKIEVSQTLWETTTDGTTSSGAEKIDDSCGNDDLPDDDKKNCSKYYAVRAFVFLKLFAVFLGLGCPVAWFVLQRLRGDDASSSLQKHLLTVSIASNAFASLCAFVATCIAPSLEFGNMDGVGAAGAGYVLTILSMIFCLWPAIILECYVWRKVYYLSSGPAETKASSPPEANLPTLVGAGSSTKDDGVKVQSVSDENV